jgi:putative membrane protein
MKNFIKGIIVGFGGVSPGLSGSVLMVIFGLYEKVVGAIGSIFKKFKENFLFLLPILSGCVIGVLLFSKLIDFILESFPQQTRFTFLGLIIGTLPLFYKEVKKKGFSKKYYLLVLLSAVLGLTVLYFGASVFAPIENPGILTSFILGIAVAASSIVPGVDSAVILSAFGLYEAYIKALADFDLHVLIPAAFGVAAGVLIFSFLMSFLLKRFYTVTFSIIFGFFISIIPSVLTEECIPRMNIATLISFILLILGFLLSFYLGDIKKNNERIKTLFAKTK